MDLEILVPIRDNQASRTKLQPSQVGNRFFKNLLQGVRWRVSEVSAEAAGTNAGKETDNQAQRLPPQLRRNNMGRSGAHLRVKCEAMWAE